MGIGRIAALLGSLGPTAGAEQTPPPETGPDTTAITSPAGSQGDSRQGPGDESAAAQIQAVLAAIRQLQETAARDGAAVPLSPSGALLRDTVGALGHLLDSARATGAALPRPLLADTAAEVAGLETGLDGLRQTVEQRLHDMEAGRAARVSAAADRFFAEMQAAVTHVRGVLGGFRGI